MVNSQIYTLKEPGFNNKYQEARVLSSTSKYQSVLFWNNTDYSGKGKDK